MRRDWLALLVLLTFAASLGFPLRPVSAAPTESLVITGGGVMETVSLTMDSLREMPQYEHIYSTINTFPTKQFYIARGVKLRDLLDLAGISPEAESIRFVSSDGYEVTLTVQELLREPRSYYPFLKDNHPSDGCIPGSSRESQEVEPILAMFSSEGEEDPEAMNDRDALLLVIGQRDVTEQTNNLFLKYVSLIEVLTDEPPQWDAPKADIDSGEVPAGTSIKLSNRKGDVDKIYYTTDGSVPTVHSPMYNRISSRWLIQREGWELINLPIAIDEDTVIKAVTIGPGKTDSEVVTFTYQADFTGKEIDLSRGRPAGITLDRAAIGLKPGASQELLPNVNWGGGPEQILFYSSSDTSVVTVDSQGLITRINPGSATITVRSADGQYTASVLVHDPEQSDEQAAAGLLPENNGTPVGLTDLSEESDEAVEMVPEPEISPPPLPEEPEPSLIPEGKGRYLAEQKQPAPSVLPESQVLRPEWHVFELSLEDSLIPEAEGLSLMDLYVTLVFALFLFAGALEKYRAYIKEINR